MAPEPAVVEVGQGGALFDFNVAGGETPATISFHGKPDAIGILESTVEVVAGGRLQLRTFIYP